VLAAGLDGVDGYETIYPLRYHELFGTLIAPQLTTDPYDFVHWGNRAYASSPQVDMDAADLLGVRWLYVRGQGVGDPTLTARFTDGDVTVYENAGAFPRSFIAHEVRVLPDRAAVTKAVGEGTADELRGRVFLAAADVPAGGPALVGGRAAAAPPDPTDTASIEADSIDRIAIRTHSVAPGVLVLADTYSPDWVADVDGAPTPILAVDGALRGVALPSGDHVVTFTYRPVATYIGIMLALAAAFGLAGWLALGRFRREPAEPRLTPSDRAAAPPS
jgi:hypothetical protein